MCDFDHREGLVKVGKGQKLKTIEMFQFKRSKKPQFAPGLAFWCPTCTVCTK